MKKLDAADRPCSYQYEREPGKLVGRKVKLNEEFADDKERIGLSPIVQKVTQQTRDAVFTVEKAWYAGMAGEFTGVCLSLSCEDHEVSAKNVHNDDAMYYEFAA